MWQPDPYALPLRNGKQRLIECEAAQKCRMLLRLQVMRPPQSHAGYGTDAGARGGGERGGISWDLHVTRDILFFCAVMFALACGCKNALSTKRRHMPMRDAQ